MKATRAGLVACAAWTLTACQAQPVRLCHEWVDAWSARLAECGYYASQEQAEAAIDEALPRGCGEVERIVLPDLWELECIPESRSYPCDAFAEEIPNACRGQLVYRRRGD